MPRTLNELRQARFGYRAAANRARAVARRKPATRALSRDAALVLAVTPPIVLQSWLQKELV